MLSLARLLNNRWIPEAAGAGTRRAAAVLLCLVLHLPAAADQDQQLEQLLDRLGLVDLQMLHLEQRLDGELAAGERLATARRLADLYAGRLVATSEDRAAYDDIMRRIQQLLEKVPQAQTPSLDVMLLQADYYRAEKLIGRWIADRDETSARQEAALVLNRIAPLLQQYQGELTARVEQLMEETDLLPDDRLREAKANELQRLQSVAGRAGYFAAWSTYYLALTTDGAQTSRSHLSLARELFQKLLGIGSDYGELKAEFLGLESIWRSRALIGLALAEASLENRAASQICFDWLGHASVPLEIKDQLPYWRLQALLNLEDYRAALELARQQVAAFSGNATPSRVSFCVSLARAGFAGKADAVLRELGLQGLAGLAKLRRHDAVGQLMEKYQIQPQADSGFYLQWILGQQLFERAEGSRAAEAYREAAAVFERALAAPEAKSDLGAAALCRSQLAGCRYRLGELEQAARMFEQAAVGLKAAGDAAAVQSAWMAFVAYQALSDKEPRFVSAAIDVLKQLKRDFPDHELAQRADYYIGKLQQNASTPAETLANLEKVQPASPNYLAARYDICALLHQQWSAASGGERRAAASRLATAVDTYLRGARSDEDHARKVKCCLLAVDAALNSDPADLELAASFLGKARPLAAALPTTESTAAEYHYWALLSARQGGSEAEAEKHNQWLVDHGQGSPYELSALVLAAKTVDADIAAADPPRRQALYDRAYRIYRRLTALLNARGDEMQASSNARVASSKLAHYASQLGKHAEAAQQLERLLAAFGKNKTYIRRAGLAHYLAGDYQESIVHWRTLLSGVPSASDEWFEAKYYQLSCLSHLDPTRFRQALKQFQLLYPDVDAPAWRDRFAELQDK